MKVCLVAGAYPPDRCGVGDHVAGLAQALSAAGVDVTVLSSRQSGNGMPETGMVLPERIATWSIAGLPGLMRAMARIRPDAVHLHYPSTGYSRQLGPNLLLPMLRMRFPGMRCILTLHEYAVFSRLGRWRLWPALLASHGICCTNHGDRRALRRQHPGLARKIRVIPLGSNLGGAATETSAAMPGNWLAHFGTVMPNKGWELLIPALRLLHDQGVQVGLKVAGELAPERYAYHRQVQALIRDDRLEPYVEFSGFLSRPQAAQQLQDCGLAVLPFRGGASLNRSSLVAVLCLGLAVITTRPRHPLEGLRPGVNYWTVPENAEDLAQAIAQLLADPERVRRLQQGSLQAGRRFAWDRIARQLVRLYAAAPAA